MSEDQPANSQTTRPTYVDRLDLHEGPAETNKEPLNRKFSGKLIRSSTIKARQQANGCNQDNEPDEWGKPCCDFCICADEAAGRKSMKDECREEGLDV